MGADGFSPVWQAIYNRYNKHLAAPAKTARLLEETTGTVADPLVWLRKVHRSALGAAAPPSPPPAPQGHKRARPGPLPPVVVAAPAPLPPPPMDGAEEDLEPPVKRSSFTADWAVPAAVGGVSGSTSNSNSSSGSGSASPLLVQERHQAQLLGFHEHDDNTKPDDAVLLGTELFSALHWGRGVGDEASSDSHGVAFLDDDVFDVAAFQVVGGL